MSGDGAFEVRSDSAIARTFRDAALGAAAGTAAGLVCSETSRTGFYRHVGAVTKADQAMARVRRLRKTVITGARLLADETAAPAGFRRSAYGRWAMLTLTYRECVKWAAKHVSELLHALREFARRAGYVARYVWCLELTKRGRPHYHVIVWLPKGRTLPKPDKRGWWQHGMTKIEWARHPVGYLAKYASKFHEAMADAVPKGARLCGLGGTTASHRIELRWWKLPLWVRNHWPAIADIGRIARGFVNRATGEWLPSPWRVIFVGGGLLIFKETEL